MAGRIGLERSIDRPSSLLYVRMTKPMASPTTIATPLSEMRSILRESKKSDKNTMKICKDKDRDKDKDKDKDK